MTDQLNSWNYCNPSNLSDNLPQPYRFINKLLNTDILNEVYNKVFEIEKYRSDPNYEGQLRTLPPQGIFDISQITALSKESTNNLVAAGDAMGNIMILDLSKKIRISKKETNGKRIIKVSLNHRDQAPDDYKNTCVIGVIAHNDPIVYIFRYRITENKLLLHYTITICKDKSCLGEYPIDITISQYCQYITVTQYNGSVTIYRIPDIKVDIATNSSQVSGSQSGSPRHQQSNFKPSPIKGKDQIIQQQPQQQQQIQVSPLDIICSELTDIVYKINFQGIQKTLKYDELILKMKTEIIQKNEPIIEEKPDPKKKGAVPPIKKPNEPIIPNQTIEEQQTIFDENDNKTSINEDNYQQPKYKALVEFITEKFNIQNGNKTFNAFKQYDCIIGIAVGWTNSTKLELHRFTQAKRISLPEYLTPSFGLQKHQVQQTNQITQIQILYPIVSLAMSKNCVHLAVGLQQGSVFVYDMLLDQEKFYLDKHMYTCLFLNFCEDWRLVSASYDGGINIYDLKDGKLLCKRTHQFRKGSKVNKEEQKQGLWRIAGISVSHTGLAAAIDAQKEVRIYDVWHGEKIGKLTAQQVMDDKLRDWNAQLIQCYKNEILISADIVAQSTTIQIFKIFDNLVNLFPALANIYRKGVEKEQVMNLYEKISHSDLLNSNFDIPNLQVSASNQLKVPGQEHRGSMQRGSQQKIASIQGSRKSNKMQAAPPIPQSSKPAAPLSLVNSLQKSSQSDQQVDFNSSFKSYQVSTGSRQSKDPQKQIVILTKEMLHPEQFLLQKDKPNIPLLIKDDISMVEHCRVRNSDKLVRHEKVNTMVQKLGQKLAQDEEKKRLQERHRQLSSAK